MIFNLVDKNDPYRKLKIAIWLYFFLLVFEGAIRKWIFPSLASPFLIVRDPVAIYLIVKSAKLRLLNKNLLISFSILIGLFSFIFTLIFGHGNVIVALFGLRPFILHFPVAFIIGITFNRSDVIKMGKVIVYLTIPMILLTITQFYSPQSAWVNKGIGDDSDGIGFGNIMGYYRPSGTFSFINGLSSFYGISAAYIFYFLYNTKIIKHWITYVALFSIIIAIPFTISRSVFFQNLLCFSFYFIIILKKPKLIRNIIFGALIVFIVYPLITENNFFKTGIDIFKVRFENASLSEGGLKGTIIDRMFLTLWDGIKTSTETDIFGKGIGYNTNVGIKLLGLNKEERISDFDWIRIISEIGPLFGIIFIIFRIYLLIYCTKLSLNNIQKHDFLPWMLLSFGFNQILQGQIAQPASVGFIVIIIGLILSCNKSEKVYKKYSF